MHSHPHTRTCVVTCITCSTNRVPVEAVKHSRAERVAKNVLRTRVVQALSTICFVIAVWCGKKARHILEKISHAHLYICSYIYITYLVHCDNSFILTINHRHQTPNSNHHSNRLPPLARSHRSTTRLIHAIGGEGTCSTVCSSE